MKIQGPCSRFTPISDSKHLLGIAIRMLALYLMLWWWRWTLHSLFHILLLIVLSTTIYICYAIACMCYGISWIRILGVCGDKTGRRRCFWETLAWRAFITTQSSDWGAGVLFSDEPYLVPVAGTSYTEHVEEFGGNTCNGCDCGPFQGIRLWTMTLASAWNRVG